MRLVVRSLFLILFLFVGKAYAQNPASGAKEVIQFSGLVVGGDSLYGIPGVSVFVPETSRGTTTSSVGYFSMPVLEGDSVIIRSLGYNDKTLIIPHSKDGKLSVIIEILEDTLMLPVVQIMPWSTERVFKEAFVALKLPQQDLDNMHKNLNEQVMKRMMYNMGPDAAMNHKYFMQQQIIRQTNKMTYDKTIPFFNPFAWGRFIEQVKRGEHKNKSKDYVDDDE